MGRDATGVTTLEAGDDTATRQDAGPAEYDGAVQPAAVGMEVERSTDDAGGADRDAAVLTAVGPTDTTTTSVGVAGMEVERSTDGGGELDRDTAEVTVKKKKKKSKKRSGRKAGMTHTQRRDERR